MTLDEVIERYTKNAEYEHTHGNLQGCLEFRQLAQWLKDYKRLLEQEPSTWNLDDAREDFMYDVCNTLDFLPTNNEANRIIDSFDRVTSSIKQEPCEDAISRQAVKDTIYHECSGENLDIEFTKVLLLQRAIKALPPVTPQPKTAHWTLHNKGYFDESYVCSKCDGDSPFDYKYCPNCGIKMQEATKVES